MLLDTTGTSFSTFSNITLFQKCNKTKAIVLISLPHKTWLTISIQSWMFDVSRESLMKSLSFVCPSFGPSLCFLKIRSLVLFDIVQDYNCLWYLLTDKGRLKKYGSLNLDQTLAQFWAFWHFLKFCSLVFFGFKYNDRFQQCLTSGSTKINNNNNSNNNNNNKILGPNLGQNRPKLGFFFDFLVFDSLIFL